MTTTARYNEVSSKLNKMFKNANESGKDDLYKSVKTWLKNNKVTDDKGKKEAFELLSSVTLLFFSQILTLL